MEERNINQTFEELGMSKAGEDVREEDLATAVKLVTEKAKSAERPEEVAGYMRKLADLLTWYAAGSTEARAEALASIAAQIYERDLGDGESAKQARLVEAVRRLDSSAIMGVYERFRDKLESQDSLRLLEVLAHIAPESEREKFAALRREYGGVPVRRETRSTEEIKQMIEKEPEEALKALERILGKDPANREALGLIARVLVRTGRANKVQGWYERALRAVEDNTLRVGILVDFARANVELLADPEAARQALAQALELEPTCVEALEWLVRVCDLLGKPREALGPLEKARGLSSGKPEAAKILSVLATLYSRLGQTEDAERTWRKLRAVDPRNLDALRFYEEYHESQGDYQKLFTTLQFALSVVEDPKEKLRLNRKMAYIAEHRLNNLERALEAHKRILAIEPNDEEAQAAVISLYEKTRKWHALIEFYNERLRRLPEDAIDERVAILFRIIDIYQDPDKLPSEDNVLATYARIVEVSPTNRQALQVLARGYESRERWPDLLRVLQKQVAVTEDPEELLELFHRIAEIAIQRMSNESQAIPFLEKILELDPENLEVVKKLKEIYRKKHNQEKLYAMYLRELPILEGQEKEQALAAAAAMARDRLLRYDEALRLYEELYRLNPNSREARENLHMLYPRLEKWREYAQFLREDMTRPMPERRRAQLRHILGEVLADRLGDLNGARAVYEQAIEEDPADDLAARRLEQIYLELGELGALEKMFRLRRDLRSFVALLAQRDAREKDPERRVALNLAMARVCEEDLRETQRAARFLENAWNLDRSLVDVARRLQAMYEAEENVESAVRVLRELVPALDEPAERIEALLKLHNHLRKLGRLQEAFGAIAEAARLALASGHETEALIEVARQTASSGALWHEYAALLREASEATMDPARRLRLLLELGEIYERKLLFHDDARFVLQQVLDLEPGNLKALDLLEDIALQLEDYAGLEDVLRRRIDVAKDKDEMHDIRLRLGRLYEDLLEDDAAAAECYLQVLETHPHDRQALQGLHRAYERSERYVDLAHVIRMEIAAATLPADVARLKCDLARLCWEHLEDFDEALRLLRDLLTTEVADAAVDQLWVLFRSGRAREAAANILAPYFRSAGRFGELETLLREMLEDQMRPEARGAIYMELADIAEKVHGNLYAAFEEAKNAVMLFPSEVNVDRLLGLAEATGKHYEAAVTIGKWVGILPEGEGAFAQTIPDAAREARICLRLGSIYSQAPLDRPDLAVRAFEKALPFQEEDEGLLWTIIGLYKRLQDINAVLATYERIIALTPPGPQRRRVLLEKALTAREARETDQAVEALERILDYDPEDEEASSLLEDILEEAGRFEDLLRTLERRAEVTTDPERRAEMLFRVATVRRDRFNDVVGAAEVLRRCLVEHPEHVQSRLAAEAIILECQNEEQIAAAHLLLPVVESLLREGGAEQTVRLVNVLEVKARLATSPWDRAVTLSDIATLEETRGRLSQAVEASCKALEAMPNDQGLLDRVVDLARRAGAVGAVVARLSNLLQRQTDEAEFGSELTTEGRARILLTLARLCREDLKDLQRASSLYDEVLELQPGSVAIMREMDSLLHEMGRDAERIPLLQEMAKFAVTLEEKRAIELSTGELCQITGDLDGAVRAYRFALEKRPEEQRLDSIAQEAANRLLPLYEALGRMRSLAELRLLLARTSEDPEYAKGHLLIAASLLEDEVKSPKEALNVLDEILRIDPIHPEALERAKALCRETGDLERLRRLLECEIKHFTDPQDRCESLLALSEVLEQMGDPSFLEPLRQAAAIGPERVVSRLVSFLEDQTYGVEAARILEEAATRSGNDQALEVAIRTLWRHEEDLSRRAEFALRLSEVLEGLRKADEAREVLVETHLLVPEDERVFQRLVGLLRSSGRLGDLAAISKKALSGLAMERFALRLRAASVLSEAELIEEAAEVLEMSFVEDPTHRDTLDTLAKLYAQAKRFSDLLRVLEAMAEAASSPDERVELYLRCASVAQEGLGEVGSASGFLWRVLDMVPLHGEALARLDNLLTTAEDKPGLRRLLEHKLAHLKVLPSVAWSRCAEVLRRLALLCLEEERFDEALGYALELAQAPQASEEDLAVVRRVYGETGFPPLLFHALVEALSRAVDRKGLLDLWKLAAGLGLEDPTPEVALREAVALEAELGVDSTDDLGALLALVPGSREIRERFIDAGRKSGRLEHVLETLRELYARHQDEDIAAEYAIDIAHILRDDLDRLEDAADYLRVAALRRPNDRELIEDLAALYEKLARFGDLTLLYENAGDCAENEEERIAYYFRAFEIARLRTKDPNAAIEVIKKVLDIDPKSRAALEALESVAREVNDLETLAHALERKAEIVASPEERKALLLEVATIMEGPLSDLHGAIRALEMVLEIAPADEEALSKLKDIYVRGENYYKLAELLEHEAENATDTERKCEALKRAAAIYESKFDDIETAINILRRILSLDPKNRFAFTRLRELLQRKGDFEAIARLLEEQLSTAGTVSEQRDVHVSLAEVYESLLNQPALAVVQYRAALSLDPYSAQAREGLARLAQSSEVALQATLALEAVYESCGEYEQLYEILQRQLELVESDQEKEGLWLRMAEIQAEKLGNPAVAIDCLAGALEINPDNREVLQGLETLALKSGEAARLYGILSKLAGLSHDPAVRSLLNQKAAEVAERDLKDLLAAAKHYQAYLEDNPGDSNVLGMLDRLYSELGHAGKLAEVLRQRIALSTELQETLALRMRLADLLVTHLGDPEGALEQYRVVLVERPGDREAIRRVSNLVEHPVAGPKALDLLIAMLREAGDDKGLAWALEKRIERAGADEDLLPLYEEAADVARRLGDEERELHHLGLILLRAPSREDVRRRLLEAADASGRFELAYDFLSQAAQVASWADLERNLRLHAARFAEKAHRPAADIEKELVRVLEIDPECKEAVEVLERLYEQQGRVGDLVGILRRKLGLDISAEEKVRALKRLAALHRMRREQAEAIKALEEALVYDPADVQVLRELVGLYEEAEDLQGLVSTLQRLGAVSSEPNERASSLLRAAELLAGPLSELRAARNLLESLLSEDPTRMEVRRRLLKVYEDLEDWQAALRLYQDIVLDQACDVAMRIEAGMKGAMLAESRLGDLAVAASILERVSGLDPRFLPVLDEQIRIYYRLADWKGLLVSLRKKATIVPAIGERVSLLSKACDLAVRELADYGLAGEIAKEILALDPANPRALLVGARLKEASGEVEEALDLYRRLSKTTGEIEERVEALLGVARITMARGDRGEEPREALRTAARFKPDHPEVNTLLRRLYLESGDYQSVVEVLQRDLKRAKSDAERANICMDIAEIFLNELNDGMGFLRWAEEAHRYKKDDPRVVVGLVNFHLKAGNAERAVPLLEWLVNYLEGKRRLRELPPYAYELARIFESKGEIEKAIEYYRMCHEHDAGHVQNALALGRLYLGREEYEKALRVYQPLIVRLDTLERAARTEVLLGLAKVHAARGDKKKARQYVLRVLAEEPENADALALLSKGL